MWVVGTVTFSAKRSTHAMSYTMDAVIYMGGGDITFSAKSQPYPKAVHLVDA